MEEFVPLKIVAELTVSTKDRLKTDEFSVACSMVLSELASPCFPSVIVPGYLSGLWEETVIFIYDPGGSLFLCSAAPWKGGDL